MAQYNLLGTKKFAELYVKGWVKNGFIYKQISLEERAIALRQKFETEKNVFSVTQILKKQFDELTWIEKHLV